MDSSPPHQNTARNPNRTINAPAATRGRNSNQPSSSQPSEVGPQRTSHGRSTSHSRSSSDPSHATPVVSTSRGGAGRGRARGRRTGSGRGRNQLTEDAPSNDSGVTVPVTIVGTGNSDESTSVTVVASGSGNNGAGGRGRGRGRGRAEDGTVYVEGDPPLGRGAACLPCRRKRAKCDAMRPICTRCLNGRTDEECQYEEPQKVSCLSLSSSPLVFYSPCDV